MSADVSIPMPSSQTDTDYARQGTVPLRQHLQSLMDAATSRIEQRVNLMEARLDNARNAEFVRINERIDHLVVHTDQCNRLREEADAAQRREIDRRFVASETMVQTAMLASDKQISAAMASSNLAVTKAESDTKQRFEGVNEWRNTVNDLIGKTNVAMKELGQSFIQRGEADARFIGLTEKIEDLQKRANLGEGNKQQVVDTRQNNSAIIAAVVAAVVVIGAIVTVVNVVTGRPIKGPLVFERTVPQTEPGVMQQQ